MGEAERWPRTVGGHVALDFVNTDVVSQGDRSTDVLRATGEFLAWCGHAGVVSVAPGPARLSRAQERTFLTRAAELRGAVRSTVEAVAGERDADPAALTALSTAGAEAVQRAVPALENGRLVWAWDPGTPDAALWELASAAVDLLRAGPTGRIKVCPGCGFVFLDSTKNGSRRWCSMDDCGKQEKMRRYVAKRAQDRTGQDRTGPRH
ncbi:CGNR zinc finger domain-containing protein [Antribacter gilvus]|uniref:CGNR zinc finger domain-containing protein n=1 Tax=Antribacter gilvus TaxID=2304675 RepID=UPI00198253A9|nr:ABATE domain-containing protein [Antribacter gilvus]